MFVNTPINTDRQSMRSLTSLLLVPPPCKSPGSNDGVKGEPDEVWDPFPAPFAPHHEMGGQPSSDARDEQECRRTPDEHFYPARDGPAPSTRKKTTKASIRPPLAAQTPPKIPKPRHANAAYYTSQPRSRFNKPSSRNTSRSRSPTPTRTQGNEGLIKITANGSVTGSNANKGFRRSPSLSRSMSDHSQVVSQASQDSKQSSSSKKKKQTRSFSPMLTRARVEQQSENNNGKKKSNVLEKSKVLGEVKCGSNSNSLPCTSSNKSSSQRITKSKANNSNQKVFMVGTNKVYSRTLIPPTIHHNAITDLWIVTINTNFKPANTISNSSGNQNININSNNNTDPLSSYSSKKAFSFRTEKEARASAYANAPPVMIPFDSQPECMLCSAKFTLFKRPRHCRNCGICICSNYDCVTSWSKKMIPETFNTKKESSVKVCTSCNALTKRFQHALLNGRYGTAVELYLTGNVNLRVPFMFKHSSTKQQKKKNESLFPIHCAIEGQSEKLLRWLVDVQHCPLHVMSTGNTNPRSSGGGGGVMNAGASMIKNTLGTNNTETKPDFIPTLKTSKGRSVIDLAMKTQHVGILRYLINEKNVSVYEVEELELALGALEALTRAFPDVDGSYNPDMFQDKGAAAAAAAALGENDHCDMSNGNHSGGSSCKENKNIDVGINGNGRKSGAEKKKTESANMRGNVAKASPKKERVYSHSIASPVNRERKLLPRDIHGVPNEAALYGSIGGYDGNGDSDDNVVDGEDGEHDTIVLDDDCSISTTIPETCILCEEKDVDCVATPCGHQMCCLKCSNQCLRCPICHVECHFIEIYQP